MRSRIQQIDYSLAFVFNLLSCYFFSFFFFHATAIIVIYTLSLHDALPISFLDKESVANVQAIGSLPSVRFEKRLGVLPAADLARSEEHTSELQSLRHLVCRLLLEKKKNQNNKSHYSSLATSLYQRMTFRLS